MIEEIDRSAELRYIGASMEALWVIRYCLRTVARDGLTLLVHWIARQPPMTEENFLLLGDWADENDTTIDLYSFLSCLIYIFCLLFINLVFT